jgi:hypothetical protein
VDGELIERLERRTARVAVLGQGYVGLVVAMRASEAGFDVVGLEPDEDRAKALADGRSYIEDVPDEVLQAALQRGYRPSSDPSELADYDVAVISVPTPLLEGLPDLSFIRSAGRMAGDHLKPGALVVLESTTYPGTTEELLGPLLTEWSGFVPGEDFLLAYSAERIDPGNPTYGLHNTPKVVGGIDAPSTRATSAFFGTFVERIVEVPGLWRSGADQDHREHLPPREHRADQRDRDVRPRPPPRRQRRDRRRGDQTLRVHAVPARARRRWALSARRPELPVLEGEDLARGELPVHRTRQRHQRAHAALRGPTSHRGPERAPQARQRLPDRRPRGLVQAQRRRHARDSGSSHHRAARRLGGRTHGRRPLRRSDHRRLRRAGPPRRGQARRSWQAATWRSCSPTTTTSTTTRWHDSRPTSSTPGPGSTPAP